MRFCIPARCRSSLTITSLSLDSRVTQWADVAGVRVVLCAGAGTSQPIKMREHAIRAMANLAATFANLKPMAHDAGCRAALIAAAASGQPERMREHAIAALARSLVRGCAGALP